VQESLIALYQGGVYLSFLKKIFGYRDLLKKDFAFLLTDTKLVSIKK